MLKEVWSAITFSMLSAAVVAQEGKVESLNEQDKPQRETALNPSVICLKSLKFELPPNFTDSTPCVSPYQE